SSRRLLIPSFQLIQLPASLILRNAVSLLDFARDLIAFALGHIQLVVGQLAPLFFDPAFEHLPITLHSIFVHRMLLYTNLVSLLEIRKGGMIRNAGGEAPALQVGGTNLVCPEAIGR